jgi:hypothetical protein
MLPILLRSTGQLFPPHRYHCPRHRNSGVPLPPPLWSDPAQVIRCRGSRTRRGLAQQARVSWWSCVIPWRLSFFGGLRHVRVMTRAAGHLKVGSGDGVAVSHVGVGTASRSSAGERSPSSSGPTAAARLVLGGCESAEIGRDECPDLRTRRDNIGRDRIRPVGFGRGEDVSEPVAMGLPGCRLSRQTRRPPLCIFSAFNVTIARDAHSEARCCQDSRSRGRQGRPHFLDFFRG